MNVTDKIALLHMSNCKNYTGQTDPVPHLSRHPEFADEQRAPGLWRQRHYAPLRVEGFSLQDACPPALPCTTLVILYNAGTGSNAVVPAGFPPPPGYAQWGNPAGWALPLNWTGAAPTAVLELWAGHAKAGSPLDYFTLASDASRAEAQAANYTRVAALARVMLQQGNPGNPNPMVQAALAADLVVVVAALTSDEGTDRDPSLALAPVDDAMIAAVTEAQPNTVVVLNAPGALVMPWADAAGAILCNWYAGQEEGNALADVLWGDVNPSGRTTVTFPMNANDTALSTPQQWPGVNGEVTYSEQLEVGYRWFDAHNVTPRFAFGHGLSYTSFEYSNIAIDTTSGAPSVLVNFTVRNAGARDGKEVAQLYVGYPPSAGEPPKLLRDFAVVHLAAGESAAVTLTLTPRDLMVWDGAWASVSGPFSAFVGASNRDLRLQGEFSLR